ncbi:UDP-N-acetylmuramoylalanine--D-glutamate ligase MurD [Caulifigura coniformis]|uniref:UDP-N-acetylmuramoylalanine--D-glutamate ligase n=1 Tax=Caulifigura coniformis TaxID=2527983 RepID=A0A517SD13_9PLAN|nr:UDP-N-acetylmuramoyl-L-alanine--D-glutamate ligase [Caulifigura coniformis]QDT54020.1 UDP-N-acetylmuramoylalanine--D-glutamate ligase MurD [Caulifigura coniformis]
MSPPSSPSPRDLRGRRVTVMGLGAFGGGEGVVRFLCERGARVTVTDLKSEVDLAATLARLDGCPIESLHLGGHREEDFRDADLVVVNPAVPRPNRFLEMASAAGVELTSEMNLFIEHNRAAVAAVTGSIGKSTTTALLERMLAAAGMTTRLGGNIGRSLLSEVEEIRPQDLVVLELSSFQLADLDRIRFRPDVAVVTNLRPNHLDWHRDLDDYRCAKQTVLRWQRVDDLAVLNADDADVSRWSTRGAVHWFGTHQVAAELPAEDFAEDDFDVESPLPSDSEPAREGCFVHDMTLVTSRFSIDLRDGFALPGRHHARNAAAACAAAMAMGAGDTAIRAALRDFQGLPHRLQPLGTFHGRRFFDDSKATTPEAAMAALEAFEEPVVLLAGGYDKHVDLGPFSEAIAHKVKSVVLMGQTASELERRIRECLETGKGGRLRRDRINVAADFDSACATAFAESSPGDAVVLSPGCASYGWFNNYVERGEAFAQAVSRWAAG